MFLMIAPHFLVRVVERNAINNKMIKIKIIKKQIANVVVEI